MKLELYMSVIVLCSRRKHILFQDYTIIIKIQLMGKKPLAAVN
jgi:hypothetical protein